MVIGFGPLTDRLIVLVGRRNKTITDLRAQLAAAQVNQVDPADVTAAAALDKFLVSEEANNP